MLRIIYCTLVLILFSVTSTVYAANKKSKVTAPKAEKEANPIDLNESGIYQFSPLSISNKVTPLKNYKGKVLLIVNTASKCGFTPQYHDLQKLYEQYKDRGFEVLGFPSNDFAGQEPGTNEDIKKFCLLNFGVSFPMFSRAPVSGSEKQPLFKYLTEDNEKVKGEILWNFEKFIIARDGTIKARFGSYINPQSQRIVKVIEENLSEGTS